MRRALVLVAVLLTSCMPAEQLTCVSPDGRNSLGDAQRLHFVDRDGTASPETREAVRAACEAVRREPGQ